MTQRPAMPAAPQDQKQGLRAEAPRTARDLTQQNSHFVAYRMGT